MNTCSYLVVKNRANKLGPKVECGGSVVAVYRSTTPDAYGVTEFPRCSKHDTKAARQYIDTHEGWSRTFLDEVAEWLEAR